MFYSRAPIPGTLPEPEGMGRARIPEIPEKSNLAKKKKKGKGWHERSASAKFVACPTKAWHICCSALQVRFPQGWSGGSQDPEGGIIRGILLVVSGKSEVARASPRGSGEAKDEDFAAQL